MKDCHKQITHYHADRVKLTNKQRAQLADRRDANRARVKAGLEKAKRPSPKRSVGQGSYTMRTIIQEAGNEYDIDDGIVFTRDSLKGLHGADMPALSARKMVRDAVDDGSFKDRPSVKANCVRVSYNDGPQVDIPVYRSLEVGLPRTYELAGADWKRSDPDGVNGWFNQFLDRQTPEGRAQARALIRLLKSCCKKRPSLSLPSGFALTVLVVETYSGADDRLDRALRASLRSVHDRLLRDLTVKHPVVDEWLVDGSKDYKTRKLRQLLEQALSSLESLDQPNCTLSMALKVWKKILVADYFDDEIEKAERAEKRIASGAAAAIIAAPKPWAQ